MVRSCWFPIENGRETKHLKVILCVRAAGRTRDERACGSGGRRARRGSADGVRGRGRPGVQWGLRKLPRRLKFWGRGLRGPHDRRYNPPSPPPFRRGPGCTRPPALPFPDERADPHPGVPPCPPSANVVRLARLRPGKEAEVAPCCTRFGPAFPARALSNSVPGLGKPPRASGANASAGSRRAGPPDRPRW